MQIYIEGQDGKAAWLSEFLRNQGHDLSNRPQADLIILNLPRTQITLEEAKSWKDGQPILCGMISPGFLALAEEKHFRLLRPLADTVYTEENAVLSAEGALYYAMQHADFALKDAHCAVLGYGKIGKSLTRMLRTLGARVTVAARREESRKEAGENSLSFEDLPPLLPSVQLLFNTVPSPVLSKDLLTLFSKEALLMELASAPYGIDLPAAREMGLRAWGEWGIPGRYCPQSAAKLLLDYLNREVFL